MATQGLKCGIKYFKLFTQVSWFGLCLLLFLILLSLQTVFLNLYLPNGLSHPYQLDESILHLRGVWCNFSFLSYFWWKFMLANSVDLDQTPRSAATDLGLHCLPRSQKWDARLIWVNVFMLSICFEPLPFCCQVSVLFFYCKLLLDIGSSYSTYGICDKELTALCFITADVRRTLSLFKCAKCWIYIAVFLI